MKKNVFTIALLISSINIVHAKLNVYDPLNQEKKEYAIDQNKPKPYVGLQIGGSLQNFRGLSTDNLNGSVNKKYYGVAYSLVAGTDFYNTLDKVPVRLEASITFRRSKEIALNPVYLEGDDGDDGESRSGYLTTGIDALIANVYVDFHNRSPITPYLTAGLGWSNPFSIKDYTVDNNSNEDLIFSDVKDKNYAPVWTAGFGLAWEYNPDVTIDLVTRFSEIGNTIDTIDLVDYKLRTAHAIDVTLGFRYIF